MTNASPKLLVDLDQLVIALETSDQIISSYLDIATGEVVTAMEPFFNSGEDDYAEDESEMDDDPARFRPIEPLPPTTLPDLVAEFSADLAPARIAALREALSRRNPMKGINSALLDDPALLKCWKDFYTTGMRRCAAQWLLDQEIDAEAVVRR